MVEVFHWLSIPLEDELAMNYQVMLWLFKAKRKDFVTD